MMTKYVLNYLYTGCSERCTRNPWPQYSRYRGSESYSRYQTTTTTIPSPAPGEQQRKRKLRRVVPSSESSFSADESAAGEEVLLEKPAVSQDFAFEKEPELEGLGIIPLLTTIITFFSYSS